MDITMCSGQGCPLKQNCKRFTSVGDKYQSYFMEPPFTMKKDLFDCEMIWTQNQTDILTQLQNITNGKG